MLSLSGRVSRFLENRDGGVEGFVLEGGEEIRFTVNWGRLVTSIVTLGAPVGIVATPRSGESPSGYWQATQITNMDSKRTATLPAETGRGKPGMLALATPTTTASLELKNRRGPPPSRRIAGSTAAAAVPPGRSSKEGNLAISRPLSSSSQSSQEHRIESDGSLRDEAAAGMARASDLLHRIHVTLAHLHIIQRQVPGINHFLDEAKHTFEQALSQFQSRDFAAVRELAAASGYLSRLVEMVIAWTLRGDPAPPSAVPFPSRHEDAAVGTQHAEQDLAEAESVLRRIRWVLENGTLPVEDCAQVRRIALWGETFCTQARVRLKNSAPEDAAEFARAALAGAYSAEHLCRRWYVGGSVHS